nr:MAG TPA: hypothetical protein [Caudoviricetes sp.]
MRKAMQNLNQFTSYVKNIYTQIDKVPTLIFLNEYRSEANI